MSGQAPPPVSEYSLEIMALLQGRVFWIYLLATYIAGSGLLPYQAGLLGIGFLTMTALVTSLFLRDRWLSLASFALIIVNPIMILYSAVVLNDLEVAFYTAFSVLFFVSSFSSIEEKISIDFKGILLSLLGSVVMTLVKPNLLVLGVMWLVLIFILLKYRLYERNNQYRFFTYIAFIPILLYEIFIDFPYVFSLWVLKNVDIYSYFSKFLLISPLNEFIRLFSKSWWSESTQPLYTKGLYDYVSYLYQLLLPESLGLIVSSIILCIPILALWKFSDEIEVKLQTWIVSLSIFLFYLISIRIASITDVNRYSLYIIPLSIPIMLLILKTITDRPSYRYIMSIFVVALILLWFNLWMSKTPKGFLILYGSPIQSWDVFIIEIISFTLIIGLFYDKPYTYLDSFGKVLFERFLKRINLTLCLILTVTVVANLYFVPQFVGGSALYKDPGLAELASGIERYYKQGSLIFTDNNGPLSAYVNDTLFRQGIPLPLPKTIQDLQESFSSSPYGSIYFSCSNGTALTDWASNPENYLGPGILSVEDSSIKHHLIHNLTNSVLLLSFNNTEGEHLSNSSGFTNDVVNHGASLVQGPFGEAMSFNGTGYLEVQNRPILNVRDALTIRFKIMIIQIDSRSDFTILSKSDQPGKGYSIYISKLQIIFQLGVTGSPLSIPAKSYVGAWHDFIFTYDGTKLQVYVDGELVASNPAYGRISVSNNDLLIGRDSQTVGSFFIGLLNELQISKSSLSATVLYTNNLSKVSEVHYKGKIVTIFQLIKNKPVSKSSIEVTLSRFEENLGNYTLYFQKTSPNKSNVSIFISTDISTKVYTRSLNIGTNKVNVLTNQIQKIRSFVVENNLLIYSGVETIHNLTLLNYILLEVTLIIFFLLLIVSI